MSCSAARGMEMRPRTSHLAAMLVATAVLASSTRASANGLPSAMDYFDTAAGTLSTIFLLNILVNLMLFSGFLLLSCWLQPRRVGKVPSSPWFFIAYTVTAATVITAIGAIVDFTLLLKANPFGYELVYDPLLWLAAVALIFVSILAASLFFLNLSLRGALVPAVGMSAVNPVWWLLGLTMPTGLAMISLGISFVLAPLFLLGLWDWHTRSGVSTGLKERAVHPSP